MACVMPKSFKALSVVIIASGRMTHPTELVVTMDVGDLSSVIQ